MWGFLSTLFTSSGETQKVVSSVDSRAISDAYEGVEREIDSLRQYDRGEKNIDAPDLKAIVRSVQ